MAEPGADNTLNQDGEGRTSRSGVSESGATLAGVALQRIIQLIREGGLRPGDLVLETDLSKRFGMSRGPIREAIRQLEGRKLVTRQAYRRARVIELTLRQVLDIFEVREALEGMACRLATRRMSDEELQQLAEDIRRAETPDNYSFVYTERRFNFHETLIKGSGSTLIGEMLNAEIYDRVRLWRWASNLPPSKFGPSAREHWQISRAMLARDEDLAESLMRDHIQRLAKRVEESGK